MVTIVPRITIDAMTRIPHLTLVVIASPEGKGDPAIGDVWGVKGSPAHTPVYSFEGALQLYEAYQQFVAGLPPIETVEFRLRWQWHLAVKVVGNGGAIAA